MKISGKSKIVHFELIYKGAVTKIPNIFMFLEADVFGG